LFLDSYVRLLTTLQWYDNVGLMYYNYLQGGGVEGGGLRLGGGLCGAAFDGGNCEAKPVYDGFTNN
jgi:hypothetical protein